MAYKVTESVAAKQAKGETMRKTAGHRERWGFAEDTADSRGSCREHDLRPPKLVFRESAGGPTG